MNRQRPARGAAQGGGSGDGAPQWSLLQAARRMLRSPDLPHADVAVMKELVRLGLIREEPSAEHYTAQRIAWELEATAMGLSYFGNALRVAMDIPGLSQEQRDVLGRYASGRHVGADHVALQHLALQVRQMHRAAPPADESSAPVNLQARPRG